MAIGIFVVLAFWENFSKQAKLKNGVESCAKRVIDASFTSFRRRRKLCEKSYRRSFNQFSTPLFIRGFRHGFRRTFRTQFSTPLLAQLLRRLWLLRVYGFFGGFRRFSWQFRTFWLKFSTAFWGSFRRSIRHFSAIFNTIFWRSPTFRQLSACAKRQNWCRRELF